MRRRDAGKALFQRSEAERTRLGWGHGSAPVTLNKLPSLAAGVLAEHGEVTPDEVKHLYRCADGSIPNPRPRQDSAQRAIEEFLSRDDAR